MKLSSLPCNDQVVGAHQDIQVIRLAGHDGLHRGLGGSGDGILHADVIDEGLHACADIGGIVGIFVAGIVDAQAEAILSPAKVAVSK